MTLRPKQTPAEGKLVINLCSVDTPITIPQPQSPQLTRFKFFLSHHLEGNRRRYTLYMGYFATTADAQKWLTILRAVYPNAFVSDGGTVTEDTATRRALKDAVVADDLSPAAGPRLASRP